eukprot:3089552-Alexandrium_andersonii.AAC.1
MRIARCTSGVGAGLGEAVFVRTQQRVGARVGPPRWFGGRYHAMRLVHGWACGSSAGARARAVHLVRCRGECSASDVWNGCPRDG